MFRRYRPLVCATASNGCCANDLDLSSKVAPGSAMIGFEGTMPALNVASASSMVGSGRLRNRSAEPPTAEEFDQPIVADPATIHVMVVHRCRRVLRWNSHRRSQLGCQAVTVASNKCMQGVPGPGWAVIETTALENARGRGPSLALDLRDQNQHMDRMTAFRFTPPTQVAAAFAQACYEHERRAGRPFGLPATSATGDV
jgi:hypothetical protein